MQPTKSKNKHPSGISISKPCAFHFEASSALKHGTEGPTFTDQVRTLKSEQCKGNCFAARFRILLIKSPYFQGQFSSSQFTDDSYLGLLFLEWSFTWCKSLKSDCTLKCFLVLLTRAVCWISLVCVCVCVPCFPYVLHILSYLLFSSVTNMNLHLPAKIQTQWG